MAKGKRTEIVYDYYYCDRCKKGLKEEDDVRVSPYSFFVAPQPKIKFFIHLSEKIINIADDSGDHMEYRVPDLCKDCKAELDDMIYKFFGVVERS